MKISMLDAKSFLRGVLVANTLYEGQKVPSQHLYHSAKSAMDKLGRYEAVVKADQLLKGSAGGEIMLELGDDFRTKSPQEKVTALASWAHVASHTTRVSVSTGPQQAVADLAP